MPRMVRALLNLAGAPSFDLASGPASGGAGGFGASISSPALAAGASARQSKAASQTLLFLLFVFIEFDFVFYSHIEWLLMGIPPDSPTSSARPEAAARYFLVLLMKSISMTDAIWD